MSFNNPLAPWHMWGTSQRMQLNNSVNVSKQLAKVNYKRPETWSFFFGARLLSAEAVGVPSIEVIVVFDIIIGVGRTSFTTVPPNNEVGVGSGFAPFRFGVAIPFVGNAFSYRKWRTNGRGPATDDLTAASIPTIEYFPAQDIQCLARGRVTPTGTAEVEVTAYFAPRTHIRPDWIQEDNQFLGNETGGT